MPLSETDIKKRTSQFHPSASHPSKLVSNNFLCQVQCRNLIWREKLLPTPIPLDTIGNQNKFGIFFLFQTEDAPRGRKKKTFAKKTILANSYSKSQLTATKYNKYTYIDGFYSILFEIIFGCFPHFLEIPLNTISFSMIKSSF